MLRSLYSCRIGTVKMNLQDILNNPPQLHRDRHGTSFCWKLSDQVLSFIDKYVGENSQTLETGAGISTVLFALKGTNHTCIVPNESLVTRIKDYCRGEGISTGNINFVISRSEDILPRLHTDRLDLVLIDGRHAFPSPFIDWYYASNQLKENGIVIVDDILIWTGKVLKDFLIADSNWTLKEDFIDACAFIKGVEGIHQKTWVEQPYLVKKSHHSSNRWMYRIRKGVHYLKHGRISDLQKDIFQMFQ